MPETATTERIAAAIALRRNRGRHLPDAFFGDPAWDALLELYAAEGRDPCLCLAELAQRLGVNERLAQRWADILETVGLLVQADGVLSISQEGRRKIEAIFS